MQTTNACDLDENNNSVQFSWRWVWVLRVDFIDTLSTLWMQAGQLRSLDDLLQLQQVACAHHGACNKAVVQHKPAAGTHTEGWVAVVDVGRQECFAGSCLLKGRALLRGVNKCK